MRIWGLREWTASWSFAMRPAPFWPSSRIWASAIASWCWPFRTHGSTWCLWTTWPTWPSSLGTMAGSCASRPSTPRLLSKYLFRSGINYFSAVQASGSLEAAPLAGYADLIADLTASGATLRENRLKTISDGTILASQACLIGSRETLGKAPGKLEQARMLLEIVEGQSSSGLVSSNHCQRQRVITRSGERRHSQQA